MVVDGKSDDGADDFGVSQRWQDGGGSSSSDADMIMLVFFFCFLLCGLRSLAPICVRESVRLSLSLAISRSLSFLFLQEFRSIGRRRVGKARLCLCRVSSRLNPAPRSGRSTCALGYGWKNMRLVPRLCILKKRYGNPPPFF